MRQVFAIQSTSRQPPATSRSSSTGFASRSFQGSAYARGQGRLCLLLLLQALVFPPHPSFLPAEEPAEETKVEGRDLASIEADLKRVVRERNYDAARALLDELASRGELKAYGLIIEHALSGVDPSPASKDFENHAGSLLAGSSDAKVHEDIYKQIQKHSNFRTRIILLEVASHLAQGGAGEPRALEAIHGALRDPSSPVQLKALQCIGKLARRESVEPLIAQLEKIERRPKNRLYFGIRECLKTVTGQDFEVAADWKNYWEAYKEGRKPRERKGGVTELYRPKFFSTNVDSDRVLFVIDISGSMTVRDPEPPPELVQAKSDTARGRTEVVKKPGTGVVKNPGSTSEPGSQPPPEPSADRERLFRAKQELIRVVDSLPESVRFGILCFSHELQFWQKAKTLRDATPGNKEDAKRWVQALRAYGATRTDLALNEALSIPEVDSIFLLTDGAPRNEQNELLQIGPILEQAKTMNRFIRCRIHTVSFEQIRDKEMRTFVRQLAAENDGTCTFLK